MDKLTLEHLAPYLPYGLKVLDMRDNETKLLNRSYNKEENAYKLTTANLAFTLIKDFRFPLLRPLDLTKEIEQNGRRFIPIIELAKIATFSVGNSYFFGG